MLFRIKYKGKDRIYTIGDKVVSPTVFLAGLSRCESVGMKRAEEYVTQSKKGTIKYHYIIYQ